MLIFSVVSKRAIAIILVKKLSPYDLPVVLPLLGNGHGQSGKFRRLNNFCLALERFAYHYVEHIWKWNFSKDLQKNAILIRLAPWIITIIPKRNWGFKGGFEYVN